DLGVECYRTAAVISERNGRWSLACQAWLGMGGIYLADSAHAPAAVAYKAAAAAAKRAELPPLEIEGLRMAGACLALLSREDDAMRVWKEAVELGAESDEAARTASTFREVGEALITLLDRRGLSRQALHVRMLLSEKPVARR